MLQVYASWERGDHRRTVDLCDQLVIRLVKNRGEERSGMTVMTGYQMQQEIGVTWVWVGKGGEVLGNNGV